MRKLMWCCLAVGAAGCCALGVAAYVWQNPDSPLGQWAMNAAQSNGARPAANDAETVIPPDPVPVEEPSDPPADPTPTGASEPLPPAVAALIPPIIIHDEEDLNASPGATAEPAPARIDGIASRPAAVDLDNLDGPPDADAKVEAAGGPPAMPRCADEVGSAPTMPRCVDDDATPIMPAACDDGPLGRGTHPSEAWMWLAGLLLGAVAADAGLLRPARRRGGQRAAGPEGRAEQ